MDVIVLGGGGHAKVVIGAIRAAGHHPIAVYDDNASLHGSVVMGVTVAGSMESAPEEPAIIAIGDNRARMEVARSKEREFIFLVHPSAFVDPSASISPGALVCAGAVIQPEVSIGAHVIVNTSASVDHEGVLNSYSQVAPGAHLGGRVKLGEGAFVGLGASLIQGINIGDWAVVGAGAVVIRDLDEGCTIVGNPAKRLLT